MINSTNLVVSKFARTLFWKDSCVVGNIATDGRWIKIPASTWENIVNLVNTADISGLSDERIHKIVEGLCQIHVLIDDTEVAHESPLNIQPHDVALELTTQCNLKCKHCSYSFGGQNYEELPFDTVIALVKWCSNRNVKRIILTGGEPFCRKDILELIKEIRIYYKGSLEIMTNATMIGKATVPSIIENIDRLHISLDGYDETSVTAIRGRGVFKRVTDVIYELQSENFTDISLSCVDTGDIQKITNFHKFAQQLHVKPIVRRLNLKGRADTNFQYENSDRVEPISSDDTNMKSICHHTYSSLFINTRSQVFPCASLREMKYNIGEFSAEKLEFELDYPSMAPIVDIIDECSSCPVRYFCASPCISQNDILFSNKEYRTKRCNKLRENLFRIIWE